MKLRKRFRRFWKNWGISKEDLGILIACGLGVFLFIFGSGLLSILL